MKIVCIWSGFFSLWKIFMLIEKVTIRTINCYDRLNVLFLREKCSLHPSRYHFYMHISFFFFFFNQSDKLLFQFYRVVFPCIESIILGKGFFFVAASCGEADPLVKYLWDFLSATVFCCCLVAVFCSFPFIFFIAKKHVGGFLFYIVLGLVRQEQLDFFFVFLSL